MPSCDPWTCKLVLPGPLLTLAHEPSAVLSATVAEFVPTGTLRLTLVSQQRNTGIDRYGDETNICIKVCMYIYVRC